jgi:group I intron endonuclease
MNIIIPENLSLQNPGVYAIRHIESNRLYIGSAQITILKRMNHHLSELKRNNHKNKHLQNCFNKYGESAFEFIIIENLKKEECLDKEQFYIDKNKENCFNINMFATGGFFSQEIILKRGESIKLFYKEANYWYRLFIDTSINIEDVPLKYKKQVISICNITQDGFFKSKKAMWNTGKTKADTDYSHLKGIPKTKSEAYINARKKSQELILSRSSEIYVYDKNNNFLGYWKNAHELEKISTSENFILIPFMDLRNKNGRNGYPSHMLKAFNVQKSCRKGIIYKGLIFKSQPLHEEIHVEKLGKNGEL